jgi:hypothetical protein
MFLPNTYRKQNWIIFLRHNARVHCSILCEHSLLNSLLSCSLSTLNHLNHIPSGKLLNIQRLEQGARKAVRTQRSIPSRDISPSICSDSQYAAPVYLPGGETNLATSCCLRYGRNRDVQKIGSEVWNTPGQWVTETDTESTSQWSSLYYLCTPLLSHFRSKICDPEILGSCSMTQSKRFFRVTVSNGDMVKSFLSSPEK